MCLSAASLCWVGWLELCGIIASVVVGFLYMPYSSLSFFLVNFMSRKLRVFLVSFSYVNFILLFRLFR
uniref:Uncharacterized protein n=1 Tax=Panstrongylus lignarius TaxID=156445 RepID=A0A224Y580_9HEMI